MVKRLVALTCLSIFFVLSGTSFVFAQRGADTLEVLRPLPEHENSLFAMLNLLNQYHYRKLPVNDSISSVIFDNYVSALDPNKIYFLKSEIDYFSKYRLQLDNDLQTGNLDFAYQIFGLYREKSLKRLQSVAEELEEEYDFTKEESYETDADKIEWATNYEELNDRWRKLLKNQALNLKLSGKDWAGIIDLLSKRYARVAKAIYQYKSEDVFQLYMNSFTRAFDPHTSYFSPIAKENFQIEMSLSLEGIGARLTQQLDYTMVASIVPGGPAFKSKRLKEDDRIVGVAQGKNGDFEDVIGWRLDDVVQKIRGPKGSVVRLLVLASEKEVTDLPDTLMIVRDKIKLEEQSAKAEVIPITEGNQTFRLGVINLPSFYIDFEARSKGQKDYRSTTRDVSKLIDDLKKQEVDGILMDLRYNGGGSLQEAIDLTGLFIPQGPVVQVRNYDQSVDKLEDDDKATVAYDGPLAVLVNRYSASASEIFSGAIQDYKRGVIVGENSFGKGTVQNLIDLGRPVMNYLNRMIAYRKQADQDVDDLVVMRDQLRSGEITLGQVKMTLAKFYRVTGSSTQKIGVSPDIGFPTPFDAKDFGESSRENSLPWDEISSAAFEQTNEISEELIDRLYKLYEHHLNTDSDLRKLAEDVEKMKEEDTNSMVSLNYNVRQEERVQQDEDPLETTIEDTEIPFTDEENEEKLSEDPYLKEALRLLAEMSRTKVG